MEIKLGTIRAYFCKEVIEHIEIIERSLVKYKILEQHCDANTYIGGGSEADVKAITKRDTILCILSKTSPAKAQSG